MSAEATGWVWRHSPYSGPLFTVQLAIADVVNDMHEYEFWMSTESLAKKARVSRSTAVSALRTGIQDGWLVVIDAGGAHRRPTRYRFVASASHDATSAPGGLTSAPGAHELKELKEIPKGASASRGLVAVPEFPPLQIEVCARCRAIDECRCAQQEATA